MDFAESVVEYTTPLRLGHPVPEARDCTALRDTLMPRLISGELRIKDATHIVGEAT